MAKLTKRYIDAIKPPVTGRAYHWDDELKGFGVLALASGSASYVVQYRTAHGQQRRMALARAGEVTPDEARAMARKALSAVRDGADPLAKRKATRQARTFAELIDSYRASDRWARKSPASRAIDNGRIERHLLPLIGNRVVETLTPDDMGTVFRAIRDGKTAMDAPSGKKRGRIRITGGEGAARRAMSLLSGILGFGIPAVIKANPCDGLSWGHDGQREAIIEDAAGYGRLFRALSELESSHLAPGMALDAIRLIALTGCRKGEIVGLRWRHIDLAHSRIVLQAHEHKAGHRTGKPKVIALPAPAVAILASIPRGDDDNALVIKPAKDGTRIELAKVWRKARDLAGLPNDLTLHGLRHSIASHLAMDGAGEAEIMTAMGHADIKTSLRYVHFAKARKSALAEKAAAVASAGLALAKQDSSDNVVKLKRGA